MDKTFINLPEIKLCGVTVRTNTKKLFECTPETNPIATLVQNYFNNGLAEKITARKNPGVTYCIYTDYESDFKGDYTYFIGEEVTSLDTVPEGFETIAIPAQNYAKFTNEPGPMPDVCINMWQNIWQMTDNDLGGKRNYIADFEVYDERSADHSNAVLDIYVGVNT